MNTTCILGQSFFVRCTTPRNAVGARWVFNGARLELTHPPDGVTPSSFNEYHKLEVTCIAERHYVTIQCIAILDLFAGEEESSPPMTIKVQGLTLYQLYNNSYNV